MKYMNQLLWTGVNGLGNIVGFAKAARGKDVYNANEGGLRNEQC